MGLLQVRMVIFILSCTLVLSLGDSTNVEDQISQIVETIEFHHNALTRHVRDLESLERQLRAENNGDNMDHMERIYNSLSLFCQSLIDESRSYPSTSAPPSSLVSPTSGSSPILSTYESPSSENPETPHDSRSDIPGMIKPEAKIVPVSYDVEKRRGLTIVTFRVLHSVPGMVTQAPSDQNTGKLRKKRLRARRGNQVAKLSTVAFRVLTDWCADTPATKRYDVRYTFATFQDRDVKTTIDVKVCKDQGGGENAYHGNGSSTELTQDKSTPQNLHLRSIYSYNLTNENLTVQKGQNITFVAAVNYTRMEMDDIMIFVKTLAYNKQHGVSESFVLVTRERSSSDPIIHIVKYNPPQFNNEFNFTTVEAIVTEPQKRAHEANQSDVTFFSGPGETKKDIGYLKITFNTFSGDNTALVRIQEYRHYTRGHNLDSTVLELPLLIAQKGESFPIPDDVAVPLHRPRQTCNLKKQPFTYTLNSCSVTCKIMAPHIYRLTINKMNGPPFPTSQQQTLYETRSAHAILRLGQVNNRDSGVYQCNIWTKAGRKYSFDIDLVVSGFATVNRNISRAYENGNNTIRFICSGTGNNVDLAINAIQSLDPNTGKADIKRIDTNPQFEKEVEREGDSLTYTLDVPQDELTSYGIFVCNASNIVSHDVMLYHIQA